MRELPVSESRLAAREAAYFLESSFPWQLFVTQTNAMNPGVDVTAGARSARSRKPSVPANDTCLRRLERGVHQVNRIVWGSRWYKDPGNGIVWGGTLEKQKNGNPHTHTLWFAHDVDLLAIFPGRKQVGRHEVIPEIENVLTEAGSGHCRVEIIRNPETVTTYCTKYVSKSGGLLVGGPWATHAAHYRARHVQDELTGAVIL